MGTTPVTAAPIEEIIALVNAWSATALRAAGADPRDVPNDIDGVTPHAETPAALQVLAGRLHRVFLGRTPDERREALNALIAEIDPTPVITDTGAAWELADPAHAELASLLMALWIHGASDPDLLRLGTCAGERCLDAFVDTTQARTRKYCSQTCQNRAKVAAYRRRQRTRSPK